MKTTEIIKKELAFWIIILAPIVFMLFNWADLPDKMPVHWNIHGEIDRYGSKFLLPVFLIGIYLLMLILPSIDPRKKNYELFSGIYYGIRIAIVSFFSIINFIVVLSGLGVKINIEKIIVPGVFILFLILGNYMGNLKMNWFLGIKTPWTLSSENVWRKTHFLAAKLWFWLSLIGFILSFILGEKLLFIIVIILVGIMSLVPVVYSYIIFKNEKNKNDI